MLSCFQKSSKHSLNLYLRAEKSFRLVKRTRFFRRSNYAIL